MSEFFEDDPAQQFDTDVLDDISEPPMFRVLLHNDNYTTMEFVVEILERVFFKTAAQATQIMLNVHRKGVGTCGVYPFDIAETKVALVKRLAEERGFPLLCTMEEE